MRFMVIVKADANSEAGVMPTEQLLTEMGKFNESLVKAGVLLAGEGSDLKSTAGLIVAAPTRSRPRSLASCRTTRRSARTCGC